MNDAEREYADFLLKTGGEKGPHKKKKKLQYNQTKTAERAGRKGGKMYSSPSPRLPTTCLTGTMLRKNETNEMELRCVGFLFFFFFPQVFFLLR